MFCLDDVLCPVQRKRQRSASDHEALTTKKPAATAAVKPAGSVGSRKKLNGQEKAMLQPTPKKTNGAAVATRICARPGCTTVLGKTNRSGKCASHFHYEPEKSRSSGSGQVAASSAGTNRHRSPGADGIAPKAANGSEGANGRSESLEAAVDLAGEFREDRLNQLLLSLTAADKARIATLWLSGRL